MTANVFDCIDVVDEGGIATKEKRYDRMDEWAKPVQRLGLF